MEYVTEQDAGVGVQPLAAAGAGVPNAYGAEIAGFQPGNDITVPVTIATYPGQIIVLGKIVGVSRTTLPATGGNCVVTVSGVFPVVKSTALAVNAGDPMKWNTATGMIDAAGTVLLGYSVDTVAATGAATRVKFIPSAV
jgi:predicted RecA/RadA family phage recombinase